MVLKEKPKVRSKFWDFGAFHAQDVKKICPWNMEKMMNTLN